MTKRGAVLPCMVAAAFAARLLTAIWFPNVIHPDETMQYLEQAYRAVTGHGLVPWEYSVGIRSWMLPGLLIPVVAVAQALSPEPAVTSIAIAATVSLLSLAIVVAAYGLGTRAGGRSAGLWAALLVAFWPEIVLMSPHMLADTIAAIPLVVALAVGYRPAGQAAAGGRALALTGLLLCLAGVTRPQLLPAIGIAALWLARLDVRRGAAMLLGALPGMAAFAIIDALTWGAPFASIVRYIHVNGAGMADAFGVSPWHRYVRIELATWRWGIPLIVATACAGMRRLPLVGLVGLVVLVTFSAVGHKEYRFIYPALPLLLILCGVGTATIVRWLEARFPIRPMAAVACCAIPWLAAGAVAANSPPVRETLRRDSGILSLLARLNADPAICGVAVEPAGRWWMVSSVRIRRDIPLYSGDPPPLTGPRAYNAVLSMGDRLPPGIGAGDFRVAACVRGNGGVCLLTRPDRCRAAGGRPLVATPDARIAAVLRRLGMTASGGR